ncbi:MAG: hypothetical protein GX275_08505 [Clostridiales bacterium]|nr:hypothetical protein [Clostridiales bacterium]
MRRRKKKGSSFVMVVFITALIFTMGTTMLAVVSTDYKTRINQSRKLQNLYQSDAGLDLVYNSINKNSDAAIRYANYRVKEAIRPRQVPITMTNDEINELFKEEFINFLGTTEVNNLNPINLGNIQANRLDNILLFGVLNREYIVPNIADTDPDYETKIRDKNSDAYTGAIWRQIQNNANAKQNADIEVIECNVENVNGGDHYIYLKVRSTFTTIQTNVTENANRKSIETSFTIKAPEYSQAVEKTSRYVGIEAQGVLKTITADGNLYAENCGDVNINGNVWVKGKESAIDDPVYDKYKNGVFVNNAKLTMQTGDLFTAGTLNLNNNGHVEVNNNVYALNANVGKTRVSGNSSYNNLFVNNLITNNDLTLNSTDSNIELNNFYGINDITINETDSQYNTDPTLLARQSSSIIVNGSNYSSIRINNDAYIMGVAYLNTANKYQTGESVAVKGNYNAYINVDNNNGNLVMKKYDGENSKSMIFSINGDSSAKAKAEYFKEYYENNNNSQDLDFGGVSINKVHATGAVVNNNKVTYNETTVEEQNTVKEYKKTFATEVFGMGTLNGIPGIENVNASQKAMAAYNRNIVAKKVYSDDETRAQGQINFSIMPRFVPTTNEANENYGKIILNPDETKNVIVENGLIKVENAQGGYDEVVSRPANDNPNRNIQAVIVTKGNVYIRGSVNYEGSIISAGNVYFQGAGEKNITKTNDTTNEVVNKIIGKYYDSLHLDDIFCGSPMSVTPIDVQVESYYELDNIYSEIYDANKYLRKGLWKLVK